MDLTIEKLVYGGEGLARVGADGGRRKAVFAPLVLPGERVEAQITEERPGFARAQVTRVIEPSTDRTAAACPYFGECGGCHYQHATYDAQLRIKEQILRETVSRIAKIDLPEIVVHPSPPLHYRNRTRMKVVPGSLAGFAIGYRKLSSRILLPVHECPIGSPLINRALQALWSIAKDTKLPKGLEEIEFFADAADENILLELLVLPGSERSELLYLAERLGRELAQITGISSSPHTKTKDEMVAAPELDGPLGQGASKLVGESHIDYAVGNFSYRVNAGSFFQTNRFMAETLLELATRDAAGKLALDLYAGVGLFTVPLANKFDRVVAVESGSSSFADLGANVPQNVKSSALTTEAFLVRSNARPDFVVVDPPRSGLGPKVVAGLNGLAPDTITYVSCDPSTMARDLPGLIAGGYRITQAHFVDMFPQTFHIETVLRMER
jgi:23S rRNA (uracil1939-C5)-methyltransferase